MFRTSDVFDLQAFHPAGPASGTVMESLLLRRVVRMSY